jgi:hypothetical protein
MTWLGDIFAILLGVAGVYASVWLVMDFIRYYRGR